MFSICGPDSWLIMARGVRLIETSMPETELRVVWEGICFVRLTFWIDYLIVEGVSTMIMAWSQGCFNCGAVIHPLMREFIICY